MRRKPPESKAAQKTIRCAIYTRKSSEEGLEQEFNSLHAQRESGEAYVASLKTEGWVVLPEHYDDGGFSGGNMDRPAMAKLLADIDAGKVDCVVVYKVDRLSRSLLDFSRIVEVFDRHNVSFVSVTQHFNTTHSMGRLTLNILLSFAQFEREIIGERIRDKIAAQRRKGKWAGGVPVLGYDVDRSHEGNPKLVVNATEASRVREIFEMYLEKGSLLPVVNELRQRGWMTKSWKTKKGQVRGGFTFNKNNLHGLLTNPIYLGKIKHKSDYFDGQHEPIIAPDVFKQVRKQLDGNGLAGSASTPEHRNRYGALLRGILYCKACNAAMVHNFSSKRGEKAYQYRYYTCCNAIKSGRSQCPSGSLKASQIEGVVLEQVREIAHDPVLRAEVLAAAKAGHDSALDAVRAERRDLLKEIGRHHKELQAIAAAPGVGTVARVADLNDRLGRAERRAKELESKEASLKREQIEAHDVTAAFLDFDNVWSRLSPTEQARVLALLVARVEYDAAEGSIAVSFHETGIKALGTKPSEKAA